MHEGLVWDGVPLRENAEEQYAKIAPLWSKRLTTPVDRYISGEGAL
jgi:hypothetical protein